MKNEHLMTDRDWLLRLQEYFFENLPKHYRRSLGFPREIPVDAPVHSVKWKLLTTVLEDLMEVKNIEKNELNRLRKARDLCIRAGEGDMPHKKDWLGITGPEDVLTYNEMVLRAVADVAQHPDGLKYAIACAAYAIRYAPPYRHSQNNLYNTNTSAFLYQQTLRKWYKRLIELLNHDLNNNNSQQR